MNMTPARRIAFLASGSFLICLALMGSGFAQQPSSREPLPASTAAVKKAEAALAQAKSAEAAARAADDKDALSIAQQAVAISERSLARAQRAAVASLEEACNVPSGLPKFVDDAIPRTATGDRIRRGCQAIARREWDVARGSFQDALDHEPGDPGLQCLSEPMVTSTGRLRM